MKKTKKKLTWKQVLSKSKKLEKQGFRLTEKVKKQIIKGVIKNVKEN